MPVPAGTFLMGSDDRTEDEAPLHAVSLPDFWIARYPTTVAQFRAFAQDSAYRDLDPAALRPPDDHPVVHVSWHDALAYAGWLGQKLAGLSGQPARPDAFWPGLADGRLHVTLPSEAEWEKAARGADGRVYPWGDAFDPQRLNIDETGIGATSPVGSFPRGASPYGVLDMLGNVWEWTHSLRGVWDEEKGELVAGYRYPYDPRDGRERLDTPAGAVRVARGASFAHDRTDAPCAYRGWDQLGLRSDCFGFRVVVALREPLLRLP